MASNALHLVTVLFNSPEVLDGFIRSLVGQLDVTFHLHVVDNSTNDESVGRFAQLSQKYGLQNTTYTKNSDNVGVAAANNQGIRAALEAGAQHVLLLNNDIEFSDASLFSRMLASARADGHRLMVPKIFYFDVPRIWCAGGSINSFTGVTSHLGEHQPDGPEFQRSRHVSYSPTCFMLIESSIFSEVGEMDEKYFVYYDDTDFVWRCRAKKNKIFYWADGNLRHKVSSSTGGSESAFTRYYASRNRLYFIRKNFGVVRRLVALAYFFATRVLKADFWKPDRRAVMFKAISDGFRMPLSNT